MYQLAQLNVAVMNAPLDSPPMARRREWLDRMSAAYMALWWVPVGHVPTVEGALARLEQLRANGPGPTAFTFAQAYGAPDSGPATTPHRIDDACPA